MTSMEIAAIVIVLFVVLLNYDLFLDLLFYPLYLLLYWRPWRD